MLVNRNPVTVRLLGLCPLVAVSQTCANSFALGLLFGAVVIVSGVVAAFLRHSVSWRLQPLYHTLLAAVVTAAIIATARIINHDAVAALGVYPALIAGNCFLLSFVQETAERRACGATFALAIRDVSVIIVFLTGFGALREFATYGRVLAPVGSVADGLLPIFASPPGALLLLALVLAATNAGSGRRGVPSATERNVFKPDPDGPIHSSAALRVRP